jgi:hypothetical protein
VRRYRCRSRWLVSTFQLSGFASQRTFTTALQKYITITSILPRQAEKTAEVRASARSKQASAADPRATSRGAYEVDA